MTPTTDLLQPVTRVMARKQGKTVVLLACGHEQVRERYLDYGYMLVCRACKNVRLAENRVS